MYWRHLFAAILALGFCSLAEAQSLESDSVEADHLLKRHDETLFLVSPMFGWDEDTLRGRNQRGERTESKDTGEEYGLFALAATKHFDFSDFVFFTDVNNADVSGNMFYANYYYDPDALITPNIGVGHLYHEIEPANYDVKVRDPMVKLGVRINLLECLHLVLNPYIAYAWEEIETPHQDLDNDSLLWGLSARWYWHMIHGELKYYYQQSLKGEDNTNTVRGQVHYFFDNNWGIGVRAEYMEHIATDDASILFGPTYVFR